MSAEPDVGAPVTVAGRLSTYLRGGGIITPIITVIFAFVAGGLVVLVTGGNPLETYKAIFDGTGLNPAQWLDEETRVIAELNLQSTLILTTPLILTGLAVAFAFRCGLFNIGGQGQYLVGTYFGVWVGSSFAGMPALLHILFAMVAACLAGAAWGAIAGLLKAVTGAHEVISTIMLNWIAVWTGLFLFGLGGPLQSDSDTSVPVSNDAEPVAPTLTLMPAGLEVTRSPLRPVAVTVNVAVPLASFWASSAVASWAVVSSVLWIAFMGVLAVYIDATANFGATYGPLAGTIGVLLWTFLSAVAVFGGLAVAAQLEAVRAGVTATRVDRDQNLAP